MPKDFHFYTEEQLEGERKRFDALKYPKLTQDDRDSMQEVFATFWYYDLSLNQGDYCFDNPAVTPYDYHQYFAVMCNLSTYEAGTLLPGHATDEYLRKHNFHIIDNIVRYPLLRAALQHHFNLSSLNSDDCPLLYQIGLYNSDKCQEPEGNKKKAPRVFFRLTNRGAFSVFLLDLYHELCPAPNRSSK